MLSALSNAFNFNLCELCPVAMHFAKAFSSFHFKRSNLITFHQFINDFSIYYRFVSDPLANRCQGEIGPAGAIEQETKDGHS